jgi:hypothetical protein
MWNCGCPNYELRGPNYEIGAETKKIACEAPDFARKLRPEGSGPLASTYLLIIADEAENVLIFFDFISSI